MKILLIALLAWIAIFVVCTTYTVPHTYGNGFSVCSEITNNCYQWDNGIIANQG